MQAQSEDQFFTNLNIATVIPNLEKDKRWIAQVTAALEELVMPVTYKQVFKAQLFDVSQETDGEQIDTARFAPAGAIHGSRMAMQAGLLVPYVFTMVMAIGLTDGSLARL